LQRAKSGQDQEGYEITLTKEWLIRLAPAIKIGLFVTQLALAYFGVMLPALLSLPQLQSNTIQAVSSLLDVCLTDQTSVIDDILSRSKTLSDLQKHFQTNKQFLRTAQVGFREIYHLLFSLEVDQNEKVPGNWIPKYTGLVLVHSPYDGTSEWVHESAVNQYKTLGAFSIHEPPQNVTNQAISSSLPSPMLIEQEILSSPTLLESESNANEPPAPRHVHWDANLTSTEQISMAETKGCCHIM
jgi:hypothetical protein